MKRLIRSSTDLLRLYIVTFGYDVGSLEDGPIVSTGEDMVYAISEDDACRRWEAENLGDLTSYTGCYARLATPEEVEEYKEYLREL